MGEFRCTALGETRRLIWLIGIGFAVVLIIQYFELPYGGVLSSFLSSDKAQVAAQSSWSNGNSSTNPAYSEDLIFFNASGSSNQNIVHGVANKTKISDGKDKGLNISSDVPKNKGSGDTVVVTDPEDESASKDTQDLNNDLIVEKGGHNDTLAALEAIQKKNGTIASNGTRGDVSSLDGNWGEIIALAPTKNDSSIESPGTISFAVPPAVSSPTFPENMDKNTSSANKDASFVLPHDVKPDNSRSNTAPSVKNSSASTVPLVKDRSKSPPSSVVPISQMNELLLQNRATYHAMKPRWSSAVDEELLQAKSLIENAPAVESEPGLYGVLFRNVSMFKRSYELMEKTLKVYIYTEGERPIFHHAVVKGIYASEGWFMKLLKANKTFVTRKPKEAHLFYLPFSSRMLEETLYVPNSHSRENLIQYLSNYLNTITSKYRFWNRTGGADHFLVACHDWAPVETKNIMAHCIRALCNADLVREGFQFGKDVSLPETYIRSAKDPLREVGGKPPSQRHILAFFAGNMHGYLRPILLNYWGNKDPDMKIFGWLPKVKGQMNYIQYMKSSKYCICAKGYEVNSPRVVEAIFYECVPVIISDNFVPPFFETLNWESFAVFVLEKDIPNLKDILLSIPQKRYLEMQRRVKQVQKHFLWHSKPVKYDIFHMILHSIWYNRVFHMRPR